MAVLGHTARIITSVTSMAASTAAWQAIGFNVESSEAGVTRLTDGQVLITLMDQEFNGPALAYFHVDPVRLLNNVQGKGLSTREVNEHGFILEGLGGIDVHVHQRSEDKAAIPNGDQNPLLGYFDALVVGVDEPFASRAVAEEVGFFVQEEWTGDYPQSDITDGLLNLSLRKVNASPFLTYKTDLNSGVLDDLTEAFGESLKVNKDNNGNPTLAVVTMPEGTRVMIAQDEENDE